MSHEITIREDGFAEAAYSMTPAWHGLGTVLDHAMSSKEALNEAGLDWQVVQEQVYHEAGVEGDRFYETIPNFLINLRNDNQTVLGMVSDQYKVVQNVEAFEFLDELVENHEMKYEAAFSLRGGKQVCLLAQMPGVDYITKDDPLLKYVLMSLSHDGTGSIKFGPVSTRVVCANTYAMAVREGNTKDLAIRHTGDIKEKMQQARAILGLASEKFSQYAEIGKQLAVRWLNKAEFGEYLDIMCPQLDPRDPDYTDRRANAIAETRMAITGTYHNERQSTAPDSAWAAFQACVEHIDHLPRRGATKERKAEARFNVLLYGAGRDMKERAFQTACKFADIKLVS